MKILRLVQATSLMLALQLSSPGWAQTAPKPENRSYTPVVAGKGGPLDSKIWSKLDQQIARQSHGQPQHIVVMVHGYWNTKEDSDSSFSTISARLRQEFDSRKVPAAILGLQWDSAVAGGEWPWEAEGAYLAMLARGRGIGRNALRQLLFHLSEKFPTAKVHLLAHSQGCEVAAASLFPEMDYHDDIASTKPLDPKRDLHIGLLCLAGSDLDYDVFYKSKVNFRNRFQLLWATVSSYIGDRDRTLYLRKASRGLGGGLAIPRMTESQYNELLPARRLILDGQDIPMGHEFAKYYEPKRVQQLVSAAIWLANSKAPKAPQQKDLDEVMALPNRAENLQSKLSSPYLGSAILALWRMEKIICNPSGSKHLADFTVEEVTRLLRSTPKKVWDVQADSKCQSVHRGYWPPENWMTEAGAPAWSKPSP